MIYVTRAIVLQRDRVLAAQRPVTMSLPLRWELPGGKVESGEAPEACLYREAWEELRLHLRVVSKLPYHDRLFKGRHYRMLPYLCEVTGGEMEVIEHAQARWQPMDRLFELDWAPAEEKLLRNWLKEAGAFETLMEYEALHY